MSMKIRIIALILTILCVLPLVACQRTENPSQDTTAQTEQDETVNSRDIVYKYQPLSSGRLISSTEGLSDYIILIPTSPSKDSVELEIATSLQEVIWERFGCRLRIAAATKRPTNLPEILIGETCRESSGEVAIDRTELGTDGYYVKNYDTTIAFVANSDEALWECLYTFVKSFIGFDARKDGDITRAESSEWYVPQDLYIRHYGDTSDAIDFTVNTTEIKEYFLVSGTGCGDACSYLSTALKTITGKSVNVIYTDKSSTKSDYEIVIGRSNRDGADYTIDYAAIPEHTCRLYSYGKKLVFAANSETAYLNGVTEFCREYLGYVKNEKAPSEHFDLTFAEGLVKEYQSASPFYSVSCGTYDYATKFKDNMVKIGGSGIQCYSLEKTKTKVMNRVRTQSAYGDVSMVYNSDDICTCELCTAAAEKYGTPYGAYYETVQYVAQTMETEGNSAHIIIGGIGNGYQAPKGITFNDRVVVLFANRRICSGHAINDASCSVNAAYAAALDAWLATGASIDVIDFTNDYAYYPATFPNFDVQYANICYYATKGIHSLTIHYDTVQASLEFGDLRSEVFTALALNPTVSSDEYHALIVTYANRLYGKGTGQPILDYILLMQEVAADGCFNIGTQVAQLLPIPSSTDAKGNITFDLTNPVKAYKLWQNIHPYSASLAKGKLFLQQYLLNNYQSTAASKAYEQFAEWILQAVDITNDGEVLEQIIAAANS